MLIEKVDVPEATNVALMSEKSLVVKPRHPLFIILCTSWVFIADTLFVRWNRALGNAEEKDKGVIYEIVHDNNAAAALVLMVPMIIIALGLIYVALLNLPYNLPTIVTTGPR